MRGSPKPNRGPSDMSIVQVRKACNPKCKLQGSERSNCMGNTLKIRIFTIHTLHFHMVVTATHNKYMFIFHWEYQKRAHLSQTYIGLKTITKKYAPSMYVE